MLKFEILSILVTGFINGEINSDWKFPEGRAGVL
jgi:hypothetical protein